ncbi:MAG: hypothetical protein IPP72_13920 [Chitinophagaceae bacterium]|nr:hypothetical protein [Chitinophagaceae bacterium]
MKKFTFIAAIFLMMISLQAKSQDTAPKGFVKGSITLNDNSEVAGYIKDDIRSKASVVMIPGTAGKKTTYDGDKLSSVTIDGIKYICMKGDFFKLLCDGELCFLQKSSDASSKPVYVGTETMFLNGTEGRPGDYFIFNKNLQQLKLVNSKNVAAVSAQSFANCEAAISKSKEAANDVAILKDAVAIYNNRNK